jgi:chromosome segregation ATPase
MIEATSGDARISGIGRIGSQPIALAAAALVIIVIGAGSIALWRAYSGTSPEQDRISAVRQVQARAALASEQLAGQLAGRTKALETSQEESIDQLQVVQDQLQVAKRQLAAQQAENKRLSAQVGDLSGAIDSLKQSFASEQAPEASSPRSTRNSPSRSRHHVRHRRPKSRR